MSALSLRSADTCLSQEKIAEASLTSQPMTTWEIRKKGTDTHTDLHDKRTTMEKAVAGHIRDGINLGIGGFVDIRTPVAIIHEVIRQGARNLSLSLFSSSICSELLAGAMIVDPDHLSLTEIECGGHDSALLEFAPLARYLARRGEISFNFNTCRGMACRFSAAASGLPFFPITLQGGMDEETINQGARIKCPFSGNDTLLLPPCRPDVALIHTQAADIYGNARIFGGLHACSNIAKAATHAIMSVDQIIPNENISNYPNLIEVPATAIDAVVEQPFASMPGASYGYYWFDMPHLIEFRKLCADFIRTGSKDHLQEYYDRNIFGCETFEDYLNLQSPRTLQEIIRLDGSQPIIID